MHRSRHVTALVVAAVAALAVLAVSAGTNPSRSGHARTAAVGRFVPLIHLVSAHGFAAPPTTAQCEEALGQACYNPQQMQTAYDVAPLYAQGIRGWGKTIVIVDSFGSPTIRKQLAVFDQAFHLPAPPHFRIIQPVGKVPPFDPHNGQMVGWAEETSLDVEYAHALAPKANLLLVETPVAETLGTHGLPKMIRAENYVINHHLGQVISQSFGATEETFSSHQAILKLRSAFKNARTHHVTVLAASGDAGATDAKTLDSSGSANTYFTHRVSSWPATDPLVTSVGGTQLHLGAKGRRHAPDNVWNETAHFGHPAAGGGGRSSVFSRPAYQNRMAGKVGTHRGVPDIALSAAENGAVLVYLSDAIVAGPAGFYLFGGTSEATPLFAAIVALADQKAGHNLGFLNPALYRLAVTAGSGIVDITRGNNTVTFRQGGATRTVHGWVAGRGYDLASGLGTVDAAKLVTALAR